MKVSIIISTRNRIKLLLERSLPSVLNQTFRDFDVLIIDDASEDGTYDKIMALQHPRITCIRNFERRGLAANKNLGTDYCKGEYVVFLDDDNELHPVFLWTMVNYLEAGYDIATTNKIIVYPEGKAIHKLKTKGSVNDGWMFKKEILKEVRFDETLQANEDADLGLRLWEKPRKVCFSEKPLMTVYASPIFNTTSYSDYTDYHLDGLAKFWLKHHQYEEYIGRMFMLRSGKKWFRWMYWLETKIKRYYHIWLS